MDTSLVKKDCNTLADSRGGEFVTISAYLSRCIILIGVSLDAVLLCPPQPAGRRGREKGRAAMSLQGELIEDTDLKCQLLGRQHMPTEK